MIQAKRIYLVFITIIVIVLSTPLSSPYSAEEDEIKELQLKITDLEKRIKQLEGILLQYQVPLKDNSDQEQGWWNKKNWRSLKKGMTSDEVKKILGKPIKTIKGARTLWYYPNVYCGYVSFDEKGNLTDWNEP